MLNRKTVMTNPRREPCDEDYTYIAAFASIWDCQFVATIYRRRGLITGCIFRTTLPLEDGVPDVLLYAYLICTDNYNCVKNIDIDKIIYINKEDKYILLVIIDIDEYKKIIKCIDRNDDNKNEKNLVCLNELSDLKEHIECITLPE